MKETRKEIVEQTRNKVAAQYQKVIKAKENVIKELKDEIKRLQIKCDHQAKHITELISELKQYRKE